MIGHSCPFLEELPYIQTMYHKRTELLGAVSAVAFFCSVALGSVTQAWAQAPEPSAQPSASKPTPPPSTAGAPSATAAPPAGKLGEPPQEPPTEAERLIDVAIKKIAALKSVSADLVQSIVMLKQKFDIKGRFLKAPDSRTYLRLTVSGLPDSDGTMLQICDGDTLWEFQKILESQQYRKVSIKPVLERLNSPDMDATTRDQILNQMGFAGPDVLLVGLRKAVRFDQKEEDVLDGKPMWVLRGTWRNRSGLVGPDQRPMPATGPLPAFVPSLATLYLGKDDGWPYRLDLLGKVPTILQDTRRVGPDGKPLGSRSSIEKVDASEIRLVYSNVLLNPTIRPVEFAFQPPPNATVEDNTELLIKGLDQAIQVQVMKKRAEAARQEGPVLDQPIDIPKPPPDPTPK
jgi:outer membrane lipoprotein-sorting protein